MTRPLFLSGYGHKADADPLPYETTWEELAHSLTSDWVRTDCNCHTQAPDKTCPHKDGASWSPARIRAGMSRASGNVEALCCLVFDLDGLTLDRLIEVSGTLEAAGVAHLVHSTHSSRPPTQVCARLAIQTDRDILPSELAAVRAGVVTRYQIPTDPACEDPSRLYFGPSCPLDADPLGYVAPGASIVVGDFVNTPIPTAKTSPVAATPATFGPASPALLAEARGYLTRHGPAVQGQTGDKHTFKAAALLTHDFGLSAAEALPLLAEWNKTCRPPWDAADLEAKLAHGAQYASQHTKGCRRDDVPYGDMALRSAWAKRTPAPADPAPHTEAPGGPAPDALRRRLRRRATTLAKSADPRKLLRSIALGLLGKNLKDAHPFADKDDLEHVAHEAARCRASWTSFRAVVAPSANLTEGAEWTDWDVWAESLYQGKRDWWAKHRAAKLGNAVLVNVSTSYGGCLQVLRRPDFADRVLGGAELEWNDLSQGPEIGRKPFSDAAVNRIRERIELGYAVPCKESTRPAAFSKDHIWDGLTQIADEQHYHPVAEYLGRIKWDGEERIRKFAQEILRIEHPSDIELRTLRCWFVGTAARGLTPGCKMDGALVLVGPQAAKKSTLFEVLGGDWYKPFDSDFRTRDGQQISHGGWILEWVELAATRNANVESIKAFISKRTDDWVGKWQRAPTSAKRGFVIVGSSNEEDFLKDATGNRRFWPLHVGTQIDLEKAKVWRDQLWAEATAAVQAGETWWLSEVEEAVLRDSQVPFEEEDPWSQQIENYVAEASVPAKPGQLSGRVRRPVTASNALSYLGIDVSDQGDKEQKRISRIFRKMNFVRRRTRAAGKLVYEWVDRHAPVVVDDGANENTAPKAQVIPITKDKSVNKETHHG